MALALVVGAVAVAGGIVVGADLDLDLMRVNEEQTIPSYLSGLLLYGAGSLALIIALTFGERRDRLWWLVFAVALLLLGFDEAAEVHERISSRLDLQDAIVLAPYAIVVGVAWLAVVPTTASVPSALALSVAGGACWITAQALDTIHRVPVKSAFEEGFEMAGSTLVLLSLLRVAKARAEGQPPVSGSQRTVPSSRTDSSASRYS